jgi:hypothetical protein
VVLLLFWRSSQYWGICTRKVKLHTRSNSTQGSCIYGVWVCCQSQTLLPSCHRHFFVVWPANAPNKTSMGIYHAYILQDRYITGSSLWVATIRVTCVGGFFHLGRIRKRPGSAAPKWSGISTLFPGIRRGNIYPVSGEQSYRPVALAGDDCSLRGMASHAGRHSPKA